MLSYSVWFSAPSLWMGGCPGSCCVGRVYGADGAVRLHESRLRHVSNIQVLILRKICTCSFMAFLSIDQTAYMDASKKYPKTACTSLPEDEHLDLRNMSKTLQLN